ncbi:MAG TPA: hypothetical protein VM100_06185, partial [Longimicrobiales bacterium]|nr:hypothetical protein [Longimicrobiales bacterium]
SARRIQRRARIVARDMGGDALAASRTMQSVVMRSAVVDPYLEFGAIGELSRIGQKACAIKLTCDIESALFDGGFEQVDINDVILRATDTVRINQQRVRSYAFADLVKGLA